MESCADVFDVFMGVMKSGAAVKEHAANAMVVPRFVMFFRNDVCHKSNQNLIQT
jgi:hypothetical protein